MMSQKRKHPSTTKPIPCTLTTQAGSRIKSGPCEGQCEEAFLILDFFCFVFCVKTKNEKNYVKPPKAKQNEPAFPSCFGIILRPAGVEYAL